MARKQHEPTDKLRAEVEALATYGTPQEMIAKMIKVSPMTLRKHYRDELDLGQYRATARVGAGLFENCIDGNVTAQIFWMKTRGGWKETSVVEQTGAGGGPIDVKTRPLNIAALTDEEAALYLELRDKMAEHGGGVG